MASKTIEDIKNKLSIVDVVAPYVKLTKAGRYQKGLSPFTKEKTPSFFVSPDRGTYHCFSSNQGGDIFTFIEKMEGVDFKGALKILADKAGVEIVYEAKGKKDARDKLYQAVALAEQFYREQLQTNTSAKEYAKKRGITGETARDWGIGYAPDDWRTLLTYAEEKGIDVPTLLNAGLIKESDGKKGTYYDRFRNRLMFPIRDIAGRTVGFSGRTLSTDKEEAKYLNSPETDIYKKSELLYGLDKAKQEIRTRGYVLVVEGQMDLMLCHQAGFLNTIALSGTAFTETQMSLIMRFAKNVMLALDSDKAGIASAQKSAALAISLGCKVKVVPMPEGEDPADIINKDSKVFADMVAKSVHIIDFLTAHFMHLGKDTRGALELVEQHVIPLIRAIPSPIEREHFVGEVAGVLGVSSASVLESVNSVKVVEKTLTVTATANPVVVETESSHDRKVMTLSALSILYKEHPSIGKVEEALKKIGKTEEVPEKILFETEQSFGENPKEEDIELFVVEFEKEFIRQELARVAGELRLAEKEKDEKSVETLSAKIAELTNLLRTYS